MKILISSLISLSTLLGAPLLSEMEEEDTKYYTCPICGSDVEVGRFCSNCGFPDDLER